MKHELFALEAAAVTLNDKSIFHNFNLHIYEGEILGVICDSVSEEQALISLFSGKGRIDGAVRFDHRAAPKNAVRQLFEKNFYIIGRGESLISSLSVSENICIFSGSGFFVRSGYYREKSAALIREFGISLNPDAAVSGLTVRETLFTALMKAYAEKRKTIVLYRISEKVNEGEFAPVYELIKKMTARGHSFVIIDSIETNIFSGADQVMVIRSWTSVACFDAAFFDRKSFWDYLFREQPDSRENQPGFSLLESSYEDEDIPAISLQNITTDVLKDISFSADKGELLKILCLDQRTIRGFRDIVSGEALLTGGTIKVCGRTFSRPTDFGDALKRGVAWCPEAPYENQIIATMSIRDNLMLPLAKKIKGIWMQKRFPDHIDEQLLAALNIRTPQEKAASFPPEVLQRIVYMRFLISAPSVLFIEKPFADTDVHIRETTLEMIKVLLIRGVAVILLMTSPSTLSLIDGDEIFAKGGRIISEEEMYQTFYGTET